MINLKNCLIKIKSFTWKQKVLTGLAIIALGVASKFLLFNKTEAKISYETEIVTKGTLINSISASGTITSGNNTDIQTKVSGVVSAVYVTNGEMVVKGQKIAEITLDDYAKERQAATWVAYLEATEAVKKAVSDKATADLAMWQAREDILKAEEAIEDMNENSTNPATNETYTDGERAIINKTPEQKKLAFSLAESQYQNASADITNSYAKVAAALRTYQENSATIVAPTDGIITNLSLANGLTITANSSTSSSSGSTIVASQSVGKISDPKGQLIASVSLTELDITKVKANQKVNLTLDAYPEMSFTGKVLSVNTTGNVNSGVTAYPVTILLDPVEVEIYPNMAVNTEIITKIKTDVILVTTTAIQTTNDSSIVEIMKDGLPTIINVEVGEANDTQSEIISGVNEGDEVIISKITATSKTESNNTTSPFSGVGRMTTGTMKISGSGAGGPPGGF